MNKGDQHKLERRRAQRRESRLKYPLVEMYDRAKYRAKKAGIPFEIRFEDMPDIPEFCPVFPWIKIDINVGLGHKLNSPSLDRIFNDHGYVLGNIRIISLRANTLKSNATRLELKALYEDSVFPKQII